MPKYKLKPHVRACIDGANLVFLDLRMDRYRAVPTGSAPRIVGLTEDAPPKTTTEAALLALDLIETASGAAEPCVRRGHAPERRLVHAQDISLTLLDAASFTGACVAAARTLKARRLDITLASLKRRKAAHRRGSQSAERIAGAFEKLRPWYPRERICLFDSLALMGFMLTRGLAPTLVLGVRTTPFAAHCWLEIDDTLVGDMSDHCASFTPIAWV